MTFLRRFIAVLIAIIFTPVAFGLLWFGTGEVIENRLAGVIITIVGMAVLLIVVQTGHVSSGGLTLASIVVTAVGIAGLLSKEFAHDASTTLAPFSHEIARGVVPWLSSGFVFALGLAFAASSIASWTARRPTEVSAAPAIRVFVSVVLSLAAVIVGLGLITRADLALVVAGAVVIGLAVLVGMVSSAGLYISGIIVFVVGIVSFIVTSIAQGIAGSDLIAGNGMKAGATSALELGFVASFGAVLLATGIVVRAARARAEKKAAKGEPADDEPTDAEPAADKPETAEPAPSV